MYHYTAHTPSQSNPSTLLTPTNQKDSCDQFPLECEVRVGGELVRFARDLFRRNVLIAL